MYVFHAMYGLHDCSISICQTKTAWGCKKGALPSKVESLVQLVRTRTDIKLQLQPSRSED